MYELRIFDKKDSEMPTIYHVDGIKKAIVTIVQLSAYHCFRIEIKKNV